MVHLVWCVECEYGTLVSHVKMSLGTDCRFGALFVPNGDQYKILANVIRVARKNSPIESKMKSQSGCDRPPRGTGRRLPAPHQKAIIDHIASDEPFRTAVTKRWAESGIDDKLAQSFLEDPTAAAADIALAVATLAIDRVTAERDDAMRALGDLSAKLAEAKNRFQNAKRDHQTALELQAASDKRSRQGLNRSADMAEVRLREAERQNSELENKLAGLQHENELLGAGLARITERTTKRENCGAKRSNATGITDGGSNTH